MALEKINIERPDWLENAIPEEIGKLALIHRGKVPDVLKGWFVVVSCMRLLRCIYGDDLSSVLALRRRVLDDAEEWIKLQNMSTEEVKVYIERHSQKDGQ